MSDGGLVNVKWVMRFLGLALLPAFLWLPTTAQALPERFTDTSVISGLNIPTSVAFAPDGRVFVGEKRGVIEVFDGLDDPTPTMFADLRTQTYNIGDRGLMSLALDPDFPERPYVYIAYVYDAEIGGTAPKWGSPNQNSDPCPTPPGPTEDGCVASGRLSRLTADGDTMSTEKVLINDWCQQFWTHSMGDIAFGADGSLYVTAGDGASYGGADYGQRGIPLNPCGDPPVGVGGSQTPPTAEGGALRSQDYRTTGDPLGLDGSLIHVDPDTGRPIPDMPNGTNQSTLNQGRIAAYGFRNPFRIAARPGTNEIWIGDVGWSKWEEINRVRSDSVPDFGWPCYEGTTLKPAGYFNLGLNICNDLYADGTARAPYYTFEHGQPLTPGDDCELDNGSAISGMEFYPPQAGTAQFPTRYDDGLFFTDYARQCIWFMKAGSDGLPDPNQVEFFDRLDVGAVDLELGPDGALYYPSTTYDTNPTGEIRRIAYEQENRAPVAEATATPDRGTAPLHVVLDASGSSDPDPGDELTYAWDLDGDGEFDDSDQATLEQDYDQPGTYRPKVQVSDPDGASSRATLQVQVGSPPVPSIDMPAAGQQIPVNATFDFAGSATDSQDGTLPASALDWSVVLNHCVPGGGCHQHPIQTFEGVAGGELAMPSHEDAYYLTLTLSARDSDGLSASTSIDIQPAANQAPVPTIQIGPGADGFSAGEQIGFSGSATDREDGNVPASGLSWRLIDQGCAQEPCPEWPVDLNGPGNAGDLTAPTDPFTDGLRLELTATDAGGTSTTTSRAINPLLCKLTLSSRRDGARMTAAGVKGKAPLKLSVLRSSAVLISTPAKQGAKGYGRHSKLTWRSWSDLGGRVHYVTPEESQTTTARYKLLRQKRR